MEIYNEKMMYFKNYKDETILFEMTKCCGYSFIFSLYKLNTLADIYYNLGLELSHLTITKIFLKNINNEEFKIPNDKTTTIQEFVNINRVWFTPIYPLPATVVYRIFFDDGHHHTHDF